MAENESTTARASKGSTQSIVLPLAVVGVVAQLLPLFLFNNPAAAQVILIIWSLFTCLVMIRGTKRDRIISLVTLAVMILVMVAGFFAYR
ncbi:hypothetical protein ACIGB8_22445 [Promicromonospora sukumoe]|uniref:hypothetical protein n=1 Tax=Promicromonospora sukumoe TaxID=88382 RepID=UPI0037C92ED1